MNSKGITKENLLFTFPTGLRENEKIAALGDVAAEVLSKRPAEIAQLSIYPRIDELPEDLLDILAYDFKVDWYDFAYPIETKRALIKGNIMAHKRQGTVFATKLVINGLYPDSELEEWFTYGGENGYFRINVNVTRSEETGAVEVYSKEEIARKIESVKRLAAHLESVSYMVKHAIVVGHRIESWNYRVPECNTIRCGTYWMRKCLGWSERPTLEIRPTPELLTVTPELSGTLPVTAVEGYSIFCGAMRAGGKAEGFTDEPEHAGTKQSGTAWMPSALGWSEHREISAMGGVDGFKVEPEMTGTLPEEAQKP